VIDPGSADSVRITYERAGNQEVVKVDNDYLHYAVAPGYLGSLYSLVTTSDGVEHILSSFPEPREFGWSRPWYGGIHPLIYAPGPFDFPDIGRLYEETFALSEHEEAGASGRHWRGVRLHATLTGKGLRGLELVISYLTLPGSNLVAIRSVVRNPTSAVLPITAGVIAYLQPGGTTEGVELLVRSDSTAPRLLRAQRTEEAATDGWVAAHNPRDHTTLALVAAAGDHNAAVKAVDWGNLGGHAGISAPLRLDPGREQAFLSYLVLARSEEEARAYHALTTTRFLL
jgi:hypothetical protein